MEKVNIKTDPGLLKRLFWVVFISITFGCKDEKPQTGSEQAFNPIFLSVKEGRIATDGGLSRGVAWGDYDMDGDPDLYVANSNGQWNSLYRNNGNGSFKKMTDDGGSNRVISEVVMHGGRSEGVNWVDYDNDGDLDLYVVSRGDEANLLFRNFDNLGFTQIKDSPLSSEKISASMACWADIEGDGDLDVLIVVYGGGPNRVYKNTGAGNFEEVTDNPLASGTGRGRACACGDSNGDGLPEFYIANAMTPNFYYQNLGEWRFEAVTGGHLVEDVGYSYGVSWADYDGDGDLDLFLANYNKENFLYTNDGHGVLSPLTKGEIALEKGGASKGHSWGDYDNDGDLDLYIANGTYRPDMQNFLYINQENKGFVRDLSDEVTMHADTSAGVAHADYDRDGDLDLFVANWGSGDQVNRFYENQTRGQNWISIRLTGTISNRFGIGAKVTLHASAAGTNRQFYRWVYPITGYGSQNDYEIHFGLGAIRQIDSLQISWPSGKFDTHNDIRANQHFTAEENGKLLVTK